MNCWYCEEQLSWVDDQYMTSTQVIITTLTCPKCDVHVEVHKRDVMVSTLQRELDNISSELDTLT